jgi:hypothetical protein
MKTLFQPVGRPASWRGGLLAALALSLVAGAPLSGRADHIDDRLVVEAPRVMDFIKKKGYHNVGVLRFKATPSSPGETISYKMANRLENALILLDDDKHPVAILANKDVSRVAYARSSHANFSTARGRSALLQSSYPLAWGRESRKPDAFLTGDVQLSKNRKTVTIVVKAFDRKNPNQVQEVLRLRDVRTDRDILASMGQSYVVPRKILKRPAPGQADETAAKDTANRDQTNTSPVQDPENPVQLEVSFGGQPATLEPDSSSPGELKIQRQKTQTPQQGQEVKMVLSNKGTERVGVVLAVNGKNTLFQEDLTSTQPGDCTKWVLGPNEQYEIKGFYKEDNKLVPFRVLSEEESAQAELAPEHKGIIALHVFREGSGGSEGLNITKPDLGRKTPGQRAPNLSSARARASKATRTRSVAGKLRVDHSARRPASRVVRHQKGKRGLIVDDPENEAAGPTLTRVEFKPDSQPAVSLFIRYYEAGAPTGGAPAGGAPAGGAPPAP